MKKFIKPMEGSVGNPVNLDYVLTYTFAPQIKGPMQTYEIRFIMSQGVPVVWSFDHADEMTRTIEYIDHHFAQRV